MSSEQAKRDELPPTVLAAPPPKDPRELIGWAMSTLLPSILAKFNEMDRKLDRIAQAQKALHEQLLVIEDAVQVPRR